MIDPHSSTSVPTRYKSTPGKTRIVAFADMVPVSIFHISRVKYSFKAVPFAICTTWLAHIFRCRWFFLFLLGNLAIRPLAPVENRMRKIFVLRRYVLFYARRYGIRT